jgi:hypothetical protein
MDSSFEALAERIRPLTNLGNNEKLCVPPTRHAPRICASRECRSALIASRVAPPRVASSPRVASQLYALYKQAMVGDNTTPQPGMLALADRAKWSAWAGVKGSRARSNA